MYISRNFKYSLKNSQHLIALKCIIIHTYNITLDLVCCIELKFGVWNFLVIVKVIQKSAYFRIISDNLRKLWIILSAMIPLSLWQEVRESPFPKKLETLSSVEREDHQSLLLSKENR